jgi:hypothetical protein
MDIVKKLIHDTLERKAAADSRQLPTPSTVREPSTNERDAKYLPRNYGLLFCCHGKSYFEVCPACKRNRKAAHLEYTAFCQRHGLDQ